MLPLRQVVIIYTDLKAGLTFVSFFKFPGLATLLGSAPRETAVETLEGRCVTDVTGGCSSALTALRFVESEPMKDHVDFLI